MQFSDIPLFAFYKVFFNKDISTVYLYEYCPLHLTVYIFLGETNRVACIPESELVHVIVDLHVQV